MGMCDFDCSSGVGIQESLTAPHTLRIHLFETFIFTLKKKTTAYKNMLVISGTIEIHAMSLFL